MGQKVEPNKNKDLCQVAQYFLFIISKYWISSFLTFYQIITIIIEAKLNPA
jgi:hypothetical protein